MQKAKAVAIQGPPIIFDGTAYLLHYAKLRLLSSPKLDKIHVPNLIGTTEFKDGKLIFSDPPKTKLSPELAKSVRALFTALVNLQSSLEDYHCSLRAFRASYKGIPLCEEPRIV